MDTIDGTKPPHESLENFRGVCSSAEFSGVGERGPNLNREGMNVALLSLPLSDASRLLVAGENGAESIEVLL